jgi:hypothetical protein
MCQQRPQTLLMSTNASENAADPIDRDRVTDIAAVKLQRLRPLTRR